MIRTLRALAAVFIVVSGVLLFTSDDVKLFAPFLIVGNLLAMGAQYLEKKT